VILTSNTPLVCANTELPILPWVGAGKGYCWPDGKHCKCAAHDVMRAHEDVRHLFRLEAK
jgi:hypothetical protein